MPIDNGRLLAYLAANGEILSTQYGEDKISVHCRIPPKYLGRITDSDIVVMARGLAGKVNGQPVHLPGDPTSRTDETDRPALDTSQTESPRTIDDVA
jgi:GTP-binding protein HflX